MAQQRKKKKGYRFVPFAVVVVLAALILGAGVFFKIGEVRITGLERYTTDEVYAAAGVSSGESLVLLRSGSVAEKIKKAFSYIDSVRIVRKWPATLEIKVTESIPAAAVECEDGTWLIDKNCRLLELTNADGAFGYVNVTGIVPEKAEQGKKLTVSTDDALRLDYLKKLLVALGSEYTPRVSTIDVSQPSNVTFVLDNRFTVRIGTAESIDDKISMALEIAADQLPGEKGVINVSNVPDGSFLPEK